MVHPTSQAMYNLANEPQNFLSTPSSKPKMIDVIGVVGIHNGKWVMGTKVS